MTHRLNCRAGAWSEPDHPAQLRISHGSPNRPHHQHRQLPHGRYRRRQGVLPRSRPAGRAGSAAARLPDLVAHVPRADSAPRRALPRDRARLSGLRPERPATAGKLRLQLRQPGRHRRQAHRQARPGPVRHLRAGLRRSGRLPSGARASRAHQRHRGPERQRLRRRPGQRILGRRSRTTGRTSPRPMPLGCARWCNWRPPDGSTARVSAIPSATSAPMPG